MKVDEAISYLMYLSKQNGLVIKLHDIAELIKQQQAEIEQLKANQPVLCGESKAAEPALNSHTIIYCNTNKTFMDNKNKCFCSYGERKESEG